MLRDLTVANWKSIYEPVEFSMVATRERRHGKRLSRIGRSRVLPVAAIYGANASGKSVFIDALAALQEIVRKARNAEDDLPIVPHLSRGADEPTRFEIEFSIELSASNGERREETLIYELLADRGKVFEESLLRVRPQGEVVIFEREGDRIELYEELEGDGVAEALAKTVGIRPNATFLGELGDRYASKPQGNVVAIARNWFAEKLRVIGPHTSAMGLPVRIMTDDDFAEAIREELAWADTGIADVGFEEISLRTLGIQSRIEEDIRKGLASEGEKALVTGFNNDQVVIELDSSHQLKAQRLVAIHRDANGKEFPLGFGDESDGTSRFLNLLPILIQLQDAKSDVVFVVDELENSMHPKLTEALIRSFLSDLSTEGNSRRQLIFSTHELQLLRSDLLRRDEIWIADKEDAQTHLTRLSDFSEKGVRKDADWLGFYMSGRLGGIPRI